MIVSYTINVFKFDEQYDLTIIGTKCDPDNVFWFLWMDNLITLCDKDRVGAISINNHLTSSDSGSALTP